MEMTNIPVKVHAHLSKADDKTNNCVNFNDNDVNGNNNNNNNDSSNKKRIHDSCPQNQQESQHIQSMQALQHQQQQHLEEEEYSGWTVGDDNRVDSSFIGGTTTGTGTGTKSTSSSAYASEAINSNKRRRYRRQKSSSLISVHTNNPPVITSCHDDDELADLDDYGSWCGGSKDVISLTSKETIGGKKDEEEEEEEEVMDLTVDDYLKEDYDTHESFSRNDGDGVTFVASGGQTKNSMEYSDVDNDDNDENSNSCYSEWNDSERMTLERQDHEQSFIDAATKNNSQQDWDGYTIRNNAFTTSGWVLNRHQPQQKENIHLRSLLPSMSSSLSLLSNVSVQTVVSSSSSSSSCNDEGKNNQNQRSSSRGEKMGFGRHTAKKTAVIAINDSDQLNHEMEKLIHRTEDWSLFHVRKRILLQQQLQQEEQHQFHQKQEQCDKDTFVNPSPSATRTETTMTHNANDSDKNSILDQRNNNKNNNGNNSINAAAIQRALPSSSLTSSLLIDIK